MFSFLFVALKKHAMFSTVDNVEAGENIILKTYFKTTYIFYSLLGNFKKKNGLISFLNVRYILSPFWYSINFIKRTPSSKIFFRYFRVTEYLYKRAIHLVHNNHHLHPKIEFADLRNICIPQTNYALYEHKFRIGM